MNWINKIKSYYYLVTTAEKIECSLHSKTDDVRLLLYFLLLMLLMLRRSLWSLVSDEDEVGSAAGDIWGQDGSGA